MLLEIWQNNHQPEIQIKRGRQVEIICAQSCKSWCRHASEIYDSVNICAHFQSFTPNPVILPNSSAWVSFLPSCRVTWGQSRAHIWRKKKPWIGLQCIAVLTHVHTDKHICTHTQEQIRVASSPHLHMFGLWELERPEAAASWWIQTAYCLCRNADFVVLFCFA